MLPENYFYVPVHTVGRFLDGGSGSASSYDNIGLRYIATFDEEYQQFSDAPVPEGCVPFVVEYLPDNYQGYLNLNMIIAIPAELVQMTGQTLGIWEIVANDITDYNYWNFSGTPGMWQHVLVDEAPAVVCANAAENSVDVFQTILYVENEYRKFVNLDGIRQQSDSISGATNATYSKVNSIDNKITQTNLKLDSEIALTEGIRGAVVDVKNQPTDACIIRIYVGDQTNKRNAAAREITRLLGEGYRPYQTFGISEDLARVLFVKYPEPNDANVAP